MKASTLAQEPQKSRSVPETPFAGLAYETPGRSQQREALSLLLTGQLQPQSPAVDNFLHYAKDQGLSLEHLWWVRQADQPITSALLMPCSGRTGMMFLGGGWTRGQQTLVVELIRRTMRSADRSRVHLVQALLEPRQTLVEETYQLADFTKLATLVYLDNTLPLAGTMDCEPDPRKGWLERWGIQTQHYSPQAHELFAHTILASYEQTLDCPGLRGLRDIEDILEGHQSIGRFDPSLWHVLHVAGQPVGVMLLSPLPTQAMMELVYIGLVPTWRGKGLGKALLQWGLRLAHQQHLRSMICAVDAGNAPAVRLYESLGFVATGKKVAMVYALRSR